VTGRRDRRHEQLLDDLVETRGYGKVKEEPLDLAVWRACFGRCCGLVRQQATECVELTDTTTRRAEIRN
jgi:hypothetical protein